MVTGSNEAPTGTSGTRSTSSRDPPYSLSRYLADQNYTPGHGPVRSPVEAEERMAKELRNFDAQFCSSGDPSHGN